MILLVDDQPEVRDHVARILARKGYACDGVDRPEAALERLADPERAYTLAILDLDLGQGGGSDDGLRLLGEVRKSKPDLPVLILTGKGSVELAVKALRAGAQDFLEKDLYIEDHLHAALARLGKLAEAIEQNRVLERENEDLRRTATFVRELQALKYRPVGTSKAFADVLERARRLASIPRPVLIRGERGSGKELIAATIHHAGDRSQKPFIKVNCAAFSGNLLESEMFGHEKGAFTGASERRLGRFELANGGTLLLDEIGNMSPEFQEKVLRVIEYQEFERVGGQRPIKVDVRIIAATNADLDQMVEEKTFRADLLDRLSFEVLRMPPLRERQEDIPVLCDHFARRFAREVKLPERRFSARALEALGRYRWPGNVRELKNVVERLVFSVERDEIDLPDLPPEVRGGGGGGPGGAVSGAPGEGAAGAGAGPGGDATAGLGFTERVEALERELLLRALEESRWNQKKAAQLVGLTYDQFRHYYKKHALQRPA